jgi:hypothetical protein
MTLPDFDMKSLSAIFVPFIGAMTWVGRLHQRVNTNSETIAEFTKGFSKHVADDALAHQRIANIEGQLTLVCSSLERIERHLLDAR